jgi:hypothetical protein
MEWYESGDDNEYLRRDIPSPRGLRNLNGNHHGKVPAYSLVYAYYTRIRLSTCEKLF